MKKTLRSGALALIVTFTSITVLACSPAALPDDDFTESQPVAVSEETISDRRSETPEQSSALPSMESFSETDAPTAETSTVATTAETSAIGTTAETIVETTAERTAAPVPESTIETEPTMETKEAFTMYAAESLNVRSGPGSDYDLLGTYQRNDRISVYDNSSQWASIDYNGTLAFVFSTYLSAAEIQETTTEVQPDPVEAPEDDQRTGGSNHFNTYDNQDQQNTEDTYVLNTSSKKIHYPGCSSVPKIAPHNYATSSDSLADLEAQGYEKCKRCFK